MMVQIVCSQCNGAKQVLGMGLMMRECSICHGLGHIIVKLEREGDGIQTDNDKDSNSNIKKDNIINIKRKKGKKRK